MRVELSEDEIKMLLVAIRQVRNTFSIGQSQLKAEGKSLDPQYTELDSRYTRLHERLQNLLTRRTVVPPLRAISRDREPE